MGDIILRPYQEAAVASTLAHIRSRPVLMAPCGSGKTVMSAELIRRHGGPALFLAPRRDLVHQATAAFRASGITAIDKPAPFAAAQAIVTTPQTIQRRIVAGKRLPNVRLIIADECHTFLDAQERIIDKGYRSAPDMIGLSATPFRMDGRGLGSLYGHLVRRITYDDLIESQFLVDTRVMIGKRFDRDALKRSVKVDRKTGDFKRGQLREHMESEEARDVVCDTVSEWRRHAEGLRTVAFCTGVAHSQLVAEQFNRSGIPAAHVDGSATKRDRDILYGALARGEILVLCCADLLTYGWDLPAVEVCVFLRPTASRVLFCQAIGRVCRPSPGKAHAIVLDEVGNHETFGFLRDLDHLDVDLREGINGGDDDVTMRVTRCDECYAACRPADDACWQCGADLAAQRAKRAEKEAQGNAFGDDEREVNGTLVSFAAAIEELPEPEQLLAKWLKSLAEAGSPPGKAVVWFREEYGRLPWDPEPGSQRRIGWGAAVAKFWGRHFDPRRLPADARAILERSNGDRVEIDDDQTMALAKRWALTSSRKLGDVALSVFARRAHVALFEGAV